MNLYADFGVGGFEAPHGVKQVQGCLGGAKLNGAARLADKEAAGLLSCDTLLTLMKTQPEIMAESALYLRIYIWGLPFLFFYNIATGIFSALGDSKTPFLFLAVSSSANILVDVLFVKSFTMGVAGVAWATFLCQGVSCVLSVALVLAFVLSAWTGSATGIWCAWPIGWSIAVVLSLVFLSRRLAASKGVYRTATTAQGEITTVS